MSLHLLGISQFLFYPPDSGTGGGGSGESKDSGGDDISRDLADLATDDDSDDTGTENEEGAEGDEEDDDSEGSEEDDDVDDEDDDEGEGDEEEETEEGEEEEETEEDRAAKGERSHPTVRALKEKYPQLFKDFPQLKAAFFDYPKFLEVFPDVDAARESARKADEFDALESSIVGQSDPRLLLKVLNNNAPKSFKKMVADFPEAVKETDPQVYAELAQPVIEDLLYHANAHGTKIGDKNLRLAARHIANFVWANGGDIPDIAARKGKSTEPSQAEKELASERAERASEKHQQALSEVVSKLVPEFDSFLSQKLEGLSAFEKKQIIKETRAEVDRRIGNDSGFQATLKGLWKRAAESGYSIESKSRIRRAWLDRARLIAPKIRARLRQEALDARGEKSSGREDREKESAIKLKPEFKPASKGQKRQFPSRSGAGAMSGKRSASGVLDPSKIDWRKTSDLDILRSK